MQTTTLWIISYTPYKCPVALPLFFGISVPSFGKLLFVERTLALPSGEGGRAPARSGEVSSVKAYQQPTFDTPSAPVCATSAAPPEGEPRVLCKQQFSTLLSQTDTHKIFFSRRQKTVEFLKNICYNTANRTCRISSLVEWSLPKPQRRVRFPYPAPNDPACFRKPDFLYPPNSGKENAPWTK